MSMAPLLGLPGRVKTLIDRLTSTRASNLDNLNATVSSRAPASTALSSATWSNGRAANLDNLDAAVSGRASQASVDALPTGIINSVQRGTLAAGNGTFADITISSVNMSKAFVNVYMFYDGTENAGDRITFMAYLTSSTNLRIENTQFFATKFAWEVIEYV